jgi:hypothetical protein
MALAMEAVSTSEMSVNFYQITRRNIPENSHLHTRCRENLKSHLDQTVMAGRNRTVQKWRARRGSEARL